MQITIKQKIESRLQAAAAADDFPNVEAYVNAALAEKLDQDHSLDEYIETHRDALIHRAQKSIARGGATAHSPSWKSEVTARARQKFGLRESLSLSTASCFYIKPNNLFLHMPPIGCLC